MKPLSFFEFVMQLLDVFGFATIRQKIAYESTRRLVGFRFAFQFFSNVSFDRRRSQNDMFFCFINDLSINISIRKENLQPERLWKKFHLQCNLTHYLATIYSWAQVLTVNGNLKWLERFDLHNNLLDFVAAKGSSRFKRSGLGAQKKSTTAGDVPERSSNPSALFRGVPRMYT